MRPNDCFDMAFVFILLAKAFRVQTAALNEHVFEIAFLDDCVGKGYLEKFCLGIYEGVFMQGRIFESVSS